MNETYIVKRTSVTTMYNVDEAYGPFTSGATATAWAMNRWGDDSTWYVLPLLKAAV